MIQCTFTDKALRILTALISLILLISAPASAQWAMNVGGQNIIVSASSYCDEFEDIKFTPDQAFNFDQERPWMASKNFNPKNEEWLKFTFGKPVKMVAMRIGPSFGNGKYYYEYSRLKKFQVVLETGNKFQKRNYLRSFDSFPERENVVFFSDEPTVKSVKIIIQDVYPGTKNSFPLIGSIEPVIEVKGRVVTSSSALEEAILFLKSCRSPQRALNFVPDEGITIVKSARNANPLDPTQSINKKNLYQKKNLRENFIIWTGVCQSISTFYNFNSYQALSYMWKDTRGYNCFQLSPSLSTDELSTFYYTMTRQKTTARVKKGDKEETVTLMNTVVPTVEIIDETYTP